MGRTGALSVNPMSFPTEKYRSFIDFLDRMEIKSLKQRINWRRRKWLRLKARRRGDRKTRKRGAGTDTKEISRRVTGARDSENEMMKRGNGRGEGTTIE